MLHMSKKLSPPPYIQPGPALVQAYADTNGVPPSDKTQRVSVPIDDHVLEVFKRLAKVSNQSTGRTIGEWLGDTVEAAELMASTMERARSAPKLVTAELHAMMLGMADQTKHLQDQFSKYKGVLGEPQAGRLADTLGIAKNTVAGSPPSCNTGGKVQTRSNKKKP